MRTTITALVGALAYFATKYGVDLGPDVQNAIVVLTLFVIGIFAQDSAGSKSQS